MNLEDISLGNLLSQIIATLARDGIKIPIRDRIWHELFFEIYTDESKDKPSFFGEEILFDWEGEYPTSPELSETLNGLGVSGVVYNDLITKISKMERSTMESMLKDRRNYSEKLSRYIDYCIDVAKRHFKDQTTT